jgi:hypothetical protein
MVRQVQDSNSSMTYIEATHEEHNRCNTSEFQARLFVLSEGQSALHNGLSIVSPSTLLEIHLTTFGSQTTSQIVHQQRQWLCLTRRLALSAA